MARAMLDGRLLDLPLSPLFWHLMLDLQPPLGLDALRTVYPEAHAVLAELSRGAQCKYDPADLGLCMTLVGRDDWELLPGGASVPLTRDNRASTCASRSRRSGRGGPRAGSRRLCRGLEPRVPAGGAAAADTR